MLRRSEGDGMFVPDFSEACDNHLMSENTLPQKKRQRRSSSRDSGKVTRSQYWFEDGNVVLRTENTLFRVHQSILSRHSQIFKDTFAMPQAPSDEDERIEGCPVIRLSDTAEDMGNIISLLYDLDKVLKFRKLPANVVGSMLRLGRKYDIACLENEALRCLRHDFPTTLGEWDSSEECQIEWEDRDGSQLVTHEIISLAHEFGLFTILPAAYAKYVELLHLEDLPSVAYIPEKARECCIIGYIRILEYVKKTNTDALCPPFILPSQSCSRRGKCEANKWKTIQNLPIWRTGESNRFGIFDFWEVESSPEMTEGLCSRCRAEVKKLTDKVRSEFWSDLPTFFGLPAWADLKDQL